MADTRLIDGKLIATRVRERVRRDAEAYKSEFGRSPGLVVVLVGDDPASRVYVQNKEAAAASAGIAGTVHRLPADTKEADLLGLVDELNRDAAVDGILVQFPVPAGIRQAAVIAAIDPKKDVDGLHAENVGRLWSGEPGLVPCTPAGCLRLLEEAGVQLAGKTAVVVGRSQLVGKPIAGLLLAQSATVTIAHSRTADLAAVCRTADVLVAAVGRAKMITREFVKPGAVVLDVGINRDQAGKLCGDVDQESVLGTAGALTPVPGGVGPMTIAMLLQNTVLAARQRARS
jgi:methylenetetrahydrofolate dehydrogenase (NADP+) / methenyltetrahydrofolate cyclohydrolase